MIASPESATSYSFWLKVAPIATAILIFIALSTCLHDGRWKESDVRGLKWSIPLLAIPLATAFPFITTAVRLLLGALLYPLVLVLSYVSGSLVPLFLGPYLLLITMAAIADVSRDLKTGFTFFALLTIILGFTYCIRDINPGIGFGGLVYLGAMASQYVLVSIGIIMLGASGIVYERKIQQETLASPSKV
jgi:hypothetical protein